MMINNRLKKWSQNHILEDLLTKTPNNHPYDINNTPTIVINVCSNKAVTDKRRLIPIVLALELITGQKGLLTKAKYSLATFRLKKGMEVGVKLTLKKSNMWNFLDKLTHIILPSLAYFNKLNKISYDRCGNLAIGLEDINVFPEMDWLRELQHPLTHFDFITGADILIVFAPRTAQRNRAVPLRGKGASINSNTHFANSHSVEQNWCRSSSLQLFIA